MRKATKTELIDYKDKMRSSVLSIKIPAAFFTAAEKFPKIYMETRKTQNSQSNLHQKVQGWKKHSIQCLSHNTNNSTALAQKADTNARGTERRT